MLIVGSTAMDFWYPGFRKPKDLDIIGSFEELQSYIKTIDNPKASYPLDKNHWVIKCNSGLIIDWEIVWDATQIIYGLWIETDKATVYAEPKLLLALKLSHRYKKNSPHFLKTMEDVWFLRNKGVKFNDYLQNTFLPAREKETYTYAHPKLNQDKKGFFTDDVKYVYDHDALHEVVKHLSHPAYEFYKSDDAQVLCSKKKWDKCSDAIKLMGVLEECYVLALERSIIPFNNDPKKAFDIALMKVCTSITSGWFREWAWEHYYDAQAAYTDVFYKNFLEQKHNIRKHNGNIPSMEVSP